MSTILDKQFLKNITNLPTVLNTHDEYMKYLKSDVAQLLDATLLSHIVENGGSDKSAFLLYRYEDKYIFIAIQMGTCSGCLNCKDTYDNLVIDALDKCYITTDLQSVEKYYMSQLAYDSEIRLDVKNLYYLHPNWPY